MPVHDAMYTHSVAESLRKVAEAEGDTETVESCERVKNMAHEASSLGAKAALEMFNVISATKKNNAPQPVQDKAQEIFSGPFWMEIA